LSGGLPTYLRHVLLIAFSVVQYEHDMKAASRIPNSFFLFQTQMFSGVHYLFIRPTTKEKKKNLRKAKVKIYSYRFSGVLLE
jgi:hypothetical protein